MKSVKVLGFSMLTATLIVAALNAQTNPQGGGQPSPARLVARSGVVDIQRSYGWAPLNPGEPINMGERVRTGNKSSGAIELGPGKIVTLSERTEVHVRQANGVPIVQLETGNMKVVSAEDIQVAARETVLQSAERPVDIELGYESDRLNLTVISGAVRNGQIVIRGAQDSSHRTFTADGSWAVRDDTVVYPGAYFYPYVVYSTPFGFVPRPPSAPRGTVPPIVLNPTHPGYRPDQIVPPMTDPLRPPNLPFRK